MSNRTKFYINGEWVAPSTSDTIDVINPATEQPIGQVAMGGAADVDKAVAAAKAAFETFSQTTREERISLLEAIIAKYSERMGDVAAAISEEMGAPVNLANKAQAPAGLGHLMTTLGVLKEFEFEEDLGTSRVIREPAGVCGFITPWNWPINQIACKVAPALAAGCTMVLKPSPFTPYSALLFGEICDEIGLNAGVLNIVTGSTSEGQLLCTDPRVDMVTFTGSEGVGASIMAQAAPTLKKVHLELGGKSAMIVRHDADVQRAAAMAVGFLSVNAGQGCAIPTRLLVHNSIRPAFVDAATAFAAHIKIGNASDPAVTMGPLIRESQRAKVEHYIALGKAAGATLVCGGGRPAGLDQGFFTDFTLFDDVTNDMAIAQDEIFGPVGCIIGFDSDDDAVQIANDSRYGLNGAIETADAATGYAMAMRIRTGSVALNGGTGTMSFAPIGGYKRSGIGREYGPHWLREYQHEKSVFYPIG